ncbi:MAG: hypothetical protein Q9O62_09600 [Ardenticatenia bacterium]|nr:hypothetical protein [Ardenticatenia bacterium]
MYLPTHERPQRRRRRLIWLLMILAYASTGLVYLREWYPHLFPFDSRETTEAVAGSPQQYL